MLDAIKRCVEIATAYPKDVGGRPWEDARAELAAVEELVAAVSDFVKLNPGELGHRGQVALAKLGG